MLKLAAAVLGVPALGLATVAASGVMVVDVREAGPAGHHIVVPVPLLPARAVAGLVPPGGIRLDEHGHEMDADARHALAAAPGVIDALAAGPDGELVRVEERGELVVIRKEDGRLKVSVHSDQEQVEVEVPLALARSVLEDAKDGSVDPAAVIGALARVGRGPLVTVHSPDAEVSIRVY